MHTWERWLRTVTGWILFLGWSVLTLKWLPWTELPRPTTNEHIFGWLILLGLWLGGLGYIVHLFKKP